MTHAEVAGLHRCLRVDCRSDSTSRSSALHLAELSRNACSCQLPAEAPRSSWCCQARIPAAAGPHRQGGQLARQRTLAHLVPADALAVHGVAERHPPRPVCVAGGRAVAGQDACNCERRLHACSSVDGELLLVMQAEAAKLPAAPGSASWLEAAAVLCAKF